MRNEIVLDKKEEFKNLDVFRQVDIINTALEKIDDTNKLTGLLGFSWSFASQELAKKGAYYVATIKRFIIANPFSKQDIEKIKTLINKKDYDLLGFKIAEMLSSGRLANKSMNRSMNIDENVYKELTKFIKSNKDSLKVKDMINLAIIEFIDKYN